MFIDTQSAEDWDRLTASADACRERLGAYLKDCDDIFASLDDPTLRLDRFLSDANCAEEFKDDLPITAAYLPYDLKRRKHTNIIYYSREALSSLSVVFFVRTHEATHSLQQANSAALNLFGGPEHFGLLLSPRAYLHAMELQELEATARQGALINAWDRVSGHDMPDEIKSAATAIRQTLSGPDMTENLRTYAHSIMEKIPCLRWGFIPFSIRDGYHLAAIEQYRAMLRVGYIGSGKGQVFCRMDDRDILSIGGSMSPNLFGRAGRVDSEFRQPSRLSLSSRFRLAALNRSLGIADDRALPTVAEALAQKGFSHDSFLAYIRALPKQDDNGAAPAHEPGGPG